MPKGDHFSGNFNGPVVTGGEIDGNVTSSGNMYVGATAADLLALLTGLRAQVEAAEPAVPKREVVLESLDDLLADTEAVRADRPVEPAVARSRWEKVRSLLAGATQVTADLFTIGQGVTQVFGG
jgi:hypothetical protein